MGVVMPVMSAMFHHTSVFQLTVESQPAVDVDRLKSELLQVKDERTTLQDELDEERLMNSHLKEEVRALSLM